MSINSFSDSDRKLFVETFESDSSSVRIFRNYLDDKTICLNSTIIPDGVSDPLLYLAEAGIVKETAIPVFNAFLSHVYDMINDPSKGKMASVDVPLRLDGDDSYKLCHIRAIFGYTDENKISSANIAIKPYTEKERSERAILNIFTSDQAPHIFGSRIKRLMDKNPDRSIAYIQFDVERFKLVNDMYGVEVGDRLLKYLNDSLSVICTDDQPFSRLTSDVFMVVIVFDAEQEIIDFIRRIENTVGRKYGVVDFRLIFGVAIVEDRSLHTRAHGDNATLARQSVKGDALNNIGFYNGKLKSALYHQSSVEEDMSRAMLNNEFVMYLQPKYCISTGKIIGAEALARWMHPIKGMIPPSDFIPIFEKNGFIVKLDQVIWEMACKKIRQWIDRGITPVPISVNISREYLSSFDVVGKFCELVKKYDIPIELLEAEITESYDSEGASDVVVRMKKQGFTMLMDDFGSGFSSLNMLKTTPFDVLKIDREFLSEFMDSDRGRKIIAHTISMSHDIGLDIVAEGVETGAQAEFLCSCGCDTAQGFFYSRPIPADEFDKCLIENMKG